MEGAGLDRQMLATIIVMVAVIIGIANFFAQFVVLGYKSDPVITGAFMTIAGLVAGVRSGKDRSEKDKSGKNKEKK